MEQAACLAWLPGAPVIVSVIVRLLLLPDAERRDFSGAPTGTKSVSMLIE